eukprot:TRINITY_DN106210_c0_g1_i1.p1 TRINITY_DN106210_c0_g1~~TRINITY_DN106210_c0_g1_i1.p1  ORF type:complete len:376 (-),score=34.22 TRINITY_DN106210_c0_g1_i1:462-1562(-)
MSDDRYLILGGCGFIGRHVVAHLINNDLAAAVRVCDKTLPQLSYFSDEFQKIFNDPRVEFKQADMCNPQHLSRAFDKEHPFNIVINLAAETRYGQTQEIYQTKIVSARIHCARAAVECGGIDKYIEVSTAQVYDSDHKAKPEHKAKIKPWTQLAEAHRLAEVEIQKLELPLIIVRLPVVYGPADRGGLMPRLICGAVYQHEKEVMKFLWKGDLELYTVHVRDVAAGLCHLGKQGVQGEVYNMCDKSKTDQQRIAKILEELYGIKTDFYGSVKSHLAKLKLADLANEANAGHMTPWADMCKEKGILNSVLSPYIDVELLYNNHLTLDGSKIEGTGFQYQYPILNTELARESIQYWIDLKHFPDLFSG